MLIDTTTVTILRPNAAGDPYEAATVATVAAGVRAHVSVPPGVATTTGGDKEVITANAYVPAGTDVTRSDRVVDDETGVTYEVVSVARRRGLGLDHVHLDLRYVGGGANG